MRAEARRRGKLEHRHQKFTSSARGSTRWAREYRKRTAVERVFSRLDTMDGFETPTIQGLKKMRVRVGFARVVMPGMALGRLSEGWPGELRRFVRVA
ncbi:MAG: transposase [Hydrogenibacillus schlegelii]|uniref:Transposase n=1 Tax=Hydrogenibacillus schlegelii TaxID=1484 RepID=A0A947CVI0_HYDSH|nr:transposase [Hydrogenibacillus schlegelii]